MSVLYVLVSIAIVLLTYLYKRNQSFKRKLWWVKMAPGYPILGNATEFADSTKSMNAMHKYLLEYDGLCYIELLFRPLILISDSTFLEWLLSSNTVITKSRDYGFLYNWLGNSILTSDGAEWKKSRKILNPAFHFAILEKFVDVFKEPTSTLTNLLNLEVGKDAVDIYPYITKYTLDIICQTSMGVQLKVQDGTNTEYHDAVAGMCKIVVERAFNPLKIIDLFYHLSPDYAREKKYVKLLHKVSNDVIEKRGEEIENQKGNEEKSDVGVKRKMAFLDILLKYRDENNQPLPQSVIRREVDTIMFAGHDTTASAISFALYCLADHPEVQAKALDEAKHILDGKNDISYRDLQEMKYLEKVIKETLRLYPSVPFFSRETTEDILYDGDKIIPKGVTLLTNNYTINRNPKVFDAPDKFDPTRFGNTDLKPFAYVPFSAGPRNCLGQKFAMLEMKYALTKILLDFEILPAIPVHHVILSAETVLKSKNGIKIRIKKRV